MLLVVRRHVPPAGSGAPFVLQFSIAPVSGSFAVTQPRLNVRWLAPESTA
jgi:hypothetical protein